jgi:hypothetical protein
MKIVFLSLLVLFTTNVLAQNKLTKVLGNTSIAPVLQVNLGNAIRNTFTQDDAFGMGIGMEAYKNVYKMVQLNPRLLLHGNNYERNDGTLFKVTYLQIAAPIILNISTKLFQVPGGNRMEDGNFIKIGVGPYIATALSGKYKPDGGSFSKMSFGNNNGDNRQRIDMGITSKIVFELQRLLVTFERSVGKKNVWPTGSTTTGSLYTRNFNIALGVRLGGKNGDN